MQRFAAQIYSLLCNPQDPDYPKIVAALNQGAAALAQVLVVAMAAAFGWIPGIVAAVAALLAKRLVTSGHQATCDALKVT